MLTLITLSYWHSTSTFSLVILPNINHQIPSSHCILHNLLASICCIKFVSYKRFIYVVFFSLCKLSCLNHYSIVLVNLNPYTVIECDTTVLGEQDKTRKTLTVTLIYSNFQGSLTNANKKTTLHLDLSIALKLLTKSKKWYSTILPITTLKMKR